LVLNLLEGISDQALRLLATRSHNLSGVVASPGNRQPMPIIAMGTVFVFVSPDMIKEK
jgi:hypothetical protein